jgi:hypothetical protein
MLVAATNIAEVTSSLDYFNFAAGVSPVMFSIPFAYTFDFDDSGTVGSGASLRLTTATADITNSSGITVASGATVRLGKKATYTIGFTFQNGSTLEVFPDADRSSATLDLTNCTFAATTTVNATSGSATVLVPLGSAANITAGAGVTIQEPVNTTIWTNAGLADGTSVLVRNVTTSTTIDYEVTSGGTGYTITLTPGVDYTVGDVVEIRQSRKDVKTYYTERTSVINTTADGGSILEVDPLAGCPICTALDCDGEDYALVFDLDTTDDELDLITDGTWQTGHLMCWWKWQLTQQIAMEQFWGAWEVQSDGSFRNDVAILSSLIDTTETGDSVESTGRRIHRSDGARPIKSPTTGGGAIDLSWRDPVTVVATGSGVLPADITAIAAEVERSGGMLVGVKNLVEADEIHTPTTVEKRLRGTATVLLTKNHSGTPLVDLEVTE